MSEQLLPVRLVRDIATGRKTDVLAGGIRGGAEVASGRSGVPGGMNSYPAEVVLEARLHHRAHDGVEGYAGIRGRATGIRVEQAADSAVAGVALQREQKGIDTRTRPAGWGPSLALT